MKQVAFTQKLSGNWNFKKVYISGKEFDGKVSATGVEISDKGMVFLAVSDPDKKKIWKYAEVDPARNRIDFKLDLDGKKREYRIQVEDDRTWLVSQKKDNDKLPKEFKPANYSVCILLAREKKKK